MISTDFCVASKDEKCVISWFHPSCWTVFLYTFGGKAAAVNQRPQMLLRVWERKTKVLSKVLNSPARAPYKPTTRNTARCIWPSVAAAGMAGRFHSHTHLELYLTWHLSKLKRTFTVHQLNRHGKYNELITAISGHLRRAKLSYQKLSF